VLLDAIGEDPLHQLVILAHLDFRSWTFARSRARLNRAPAPD
jgi:hypothetical protein